MVNNPSGGAEINVQHQAVTEDYLGELINFVANHEAKLAVATLLAMHPVTYFGGHELAESLTKNQQPYEGWTPNAKTLATYCIGSFATMGLVDISEGDGKYGIRANQFRISRDKDDLLLGLTGRIMTWSLNHPDQSVQQLLGGTHSDIHMRPSITRYNIYKHLTAKPAGVPVEELVDNIQQIESVKPKLIKKHIKELREIGILYDDPHAASRTTALPVTITDSHLQPLTDLCSELETYKLDPTDRRQIDIAISIVRTPYSLAALMKKGWDFSPNIAAINQNQAQLGEQALRILGGFTVGLSVNRVREELGKNGRIIGEKTTREMLRKLETDGLIESVDVRINPNAKPTAKAYSLKSKIE